MEGSTGLRGSEKRQASCCSKRNDTELQPTADRSSESPIIKGDEASSGSHITENLNNHSHSNTKTDTKNSIPRSPVNCCQKTNQVGSRNTDVVSLAEEISKSTDCQCGSMASKRQLKDDQFVGIRVDGKPFRCLSCSEGHRASTCKHYERPVFEPKRAGRPKGTGAGVKKRKVPGRKGKCDCPLKTCNCGGECACKPECLCTARGYITVYIHGKGERKGEDPSFNSEMKGKFVIQGQAWADSNGIKITDKEAEQLAARKAALLERERRSGLLIPSTPGLGVQGIATTTFSDSMYTPQAQQLATPRINEPLPYFENTITAFQPTTFAPNPTATDSISTALDASSLDFLAQMSALSNSNGIFGPNDLGNPNPLLQPPMLGNQFQTSPSCCTHRDAVALSQVSTTVQGCNCGEDCSCAFCPQHRWNSTTQNAVQSYGDNMNDQYSLLGGFQHVTNGTAPEPWSDSCMGESQMAFCPHNSREAAVLASAQRAAPSAEAMMVFAPNEDNEYSAPTYYTRPVDGWGAMHAHQSSLDQSFHDLERPQQTLQQISQYPIFDKLQDLTPSQQTLPVSPPIQFDQSFEGLGDPQQILQQTSQMSYDHNFRRSEVPHQPVQQTIDRLVDFGVPSQAYNQTLDQFTYLADQMNDEEPVVSTEGSSMFAPHTTVH